MKFAKLCFGLGLIFYSAAAAARPLVLAHYMPSFANNVDYLQHMILAQSGRGKGVADAPLLAQSFFSTIAPWGRGLRDFAKYEIQTAIDAGVDGFVFDYGAGYGGSDNIGRNDIPHVSLPIIDAFFSVAEKDFKNFKLALALDQAGRGGDLDRRRATIQQFLLRHADSPALLREDGRPVFLSYRASGLQPYEMPVGHIRNQQAFVDQQTEVIKNWQRLWSDLRVKPFFVADLPNAWQWKTWGVSEAVMRKVLDQWAKAFDGLSVFGATDRLDQAAWLYPIMGSICQSNHKLFMAPIWWGYHPEKGRILMQGADMALETWSLAKQSGAKWVVVNTWNDYSEQTNWAPSVNHGYGLVVILRTFSEWFKFGQYNLPSTPEVIVFYRRFLQRPVSPRLSGINPWLPLDNTLNVVTISRVPGVLVVNGGPSFKIDRGVESHRVSLEAGPVSAVFHYGNESVTVEGLVPVVEKPKRDLYGTYIASSNFNHKLVEQLGKYGTSDIQRNELERWRSMVKELIDSAVDLPAIQQ